jgi:hypothetical protein
MGPIDPTCSTSFVLPLTESDSTLSPTEHGSHFDYRHGETSLDQSRRNAVSRVEFLPDLPAVPAFHQSNRHLSDSQDVVESAFGLRDSHVFRTGQQSEGRHERTGYTVAQR